ncbi:MAG: hypothetical protein ACI9G5_002767 [Paracoccaceae bacterium]|jgi:hypothetical protein
MLALGAGANCLAAELEEVIVTAQKRSQSVQDVPIAATALSADAMREAGALNTQGLPDVNPSISFDVGQSSQNADLKIRGIGTVGSGRSFEGAVGVVYYEQPFTTSLAGFTRVSASYMGEHFAGADQPDEKKAGCLYLMGSQCGYEVLRESGVDGESIL